MSRSHTLHQTLLLYSLHARLCSEPDIVFVCGSLCVSANCGLVSGCAGCKRQLDSPLPPPTRPSVLKPPPANVWHGQPKPKHVFDPIFQPCDSASENIILLHLLMTNNLVIWQFAKNADHSSDPSPKYIASPRPFPPGTSPSLSYQVGTHHCTLCIFIPVANTLLSSLRIHWLPVACTLYIAKQTSEARGQFCRRESTSCLGLTVRIVHPPSPLNLVEQTVTGRCLAKPGQKSRKIHEMCTEESALVIGDTLGLFLGMMYFEVFWRFCSGSPQARTDALTA